MNRKRILVLCACLVALVAAIVLVVQLVNTYLPRTRDLGPGVSVSPASAPASSSPDSTSDRTSPATHSRRGAHRGGQPQVPVAPTPASHGGTQ